MVCTYEDKDLEPLAKPGTLSAHRPRDAQLMCSYGSGQQALLRLATASLLAAEFLEFSAPLRLLPVWVALQRKA